MRPSALTPAIASHFIGYLAASAQSLRPFEPITDRAQTGYLAKVFDQAREEPFHRTGGSRRPAKADPSAAHPPAQLEIASLRAPRRGDTTPIP